MIYIPTSFPKASFKKLYRKDLTFIAVCWVLVLSADEQIRTEFNIVNEFPFSSSSVGTILPISFFTSTSVLYPPSPLSRELYNCIENCLSIFQSQYNSFVISDKYLI